MADILQKSALHIQDMYLLKKILTQTLYITKHHPPKYRFIQII
jgi:hypothetical protein